MGSYLGKHAEYYDLFYREKPYAKEAAYIEKHLRRYHPGEHVTLLELACGTGNHAFELEKLGYKIVALDYSSDLLQIAKRKAEEKGSRVEFILQDMRILDLPGRQFDAAYCLFDSIGYVQTNQAIADVFNGVRKHLKPNGIFIIEFWHAAAMICHFEPVREKDLWTESGRITRVAKTSLDIPHQLAMVTYSIEENNKGRSSQLEETQINRYFLVQEMASHLENNGFKAVEFLPAYEEDPVIDQDTWHILAIAQRVEE